MAIVREFTCRGHGVWESDKEKPKKCPWGCRKFERYFSAPAAIKGQRTKNLDAMQKDIANSLGLTDMSNKNGDSLATNQMKRYPGGPQSIALPAAPMPIRDENGKITKRQSIGIADAIASTGLFNGANSMPTGVTTDFQQISGSMKGTRSNLTRVQAAADREGKIVSSNMQSAG